MICFNLPGLYEHSFLNEFILDLFLNHKEYFKDNITISSIYGNFQYCIWDGGRNFLRYNQCTRQDIEQIRDMYDFFNVPMRFIFTNPVLEEKHLHDRFCNLILKLCDGKNNEVVVNSPLMENYIRENYPNYKIVSSTTKRLTNPDDFLEELNKDYYQICLDYDLNHNKELLNSIPKELRKKCEFLVNAICRPECPIRKWHYSQNGLTHLTYLKHKYNVNGSGKCSISNKEITDPDIMFTGNNLTFEEMEEYDKLGYHYFKLEGRTLSSAEILAMYLYYLIKPEYQYVVITKAANIEGIFINDRNSTIVAKEMYEPKTYRMFS